MTSRTNRRRPIRRAFTLLEVIVVVTIIALLATLIAPKVLRNIFGAKSKIAQAEVSSIANQVRIWMADNGHTTIPKDFELEWLTEGSDPYLDAEDLIDPWENPYIVQVPGEYNTDFDIVSYGEDGESGGEDKAVDIHN